MLLEVIKVLRDIFVNQIIPQLLYIIITAILGIISYHVKNFLASHKDYIEVQKQELIHKIGQEAYDRDLALAKQIILAVEQMGKEFGWESEIKHSRATEMISKGTGLSQEEIYNIIKATVGEFNMYKASNLNQITVPPV